MFMNSADMNSALAALATEPVASECSVCCLRFCVCPNMPGSVVMGFFQNLGPRNAVSGLDKMRDRLEIGN